MYFMPVASWRARSACLKLGRKSFIHARDDTHDRTVRKLGLIADHNRLGAVGPIGLHAAMPIS